MTNTHYRCNPCSLKMQAPVEFRSATAFHIHRARAMVADEPMHHSIFELDPISAIRQAFRIEQTEAVNAAYQEALHHGIAARSRQAAERFYQLHSTRWKGEHPLEATAQDINLFVSILTEAEHQRKD